MYFVDSESRVINLAVACEISFEEIEGKCVNLLAQMDPGSDDAARLLLSWPIDGDVDTAYRKAKACLLDILQEIENGRQVLFASSLSQHFDEVEEASVDGFAGHKVA